MPGGEVALFSSTRGRAGSPTTARPDRRRTDVGCSRTPLPVRASGLARVAAMACGSVNCRVVHLVDQDGLVMLEGELDAGEQQRIVDPCVDLVAEVPAVRLERPMSPAAARRRRRRGAAHSTIGSSAAGRCASAGRSSRGPVGARWRVSAAAACRTGVPARACSRCSSPARDRAMPARPARHLLCGWGPATHQEGCQVVACWPPRW